MSALLWLVNNMGWHEGALAALFSLSALKRCGLDVAIQPVYPPQGPPLPFRADQQVRPPLARARAAVRKIHESARPFDRVLVDDDVPSSVVVAPDRSRAQAWYLFTRRYTLLAKADASYFAAFDGVLTTNRPIHAALSALPTVSPARLWPVPLLLGEGDSPVDAEYLPGSTSRPTLALAGVFDAAKGLDLIVNALSLLGVTDAPWPLWALGDGPERPRMAQYAKALGVDVHFVPDAAGWSRILGAVDLMLALQFDDRLGFDAAWAARCGTPMVAHDLTSVREQIGADRAVWLSKPSVMDLVDVLAGRKWPAKEEPGAQSWADDVAPWRDALKI